MIDDGGKKSGKRSKTQIDVIGCEAEDNNQNMQRGECSGEGGMRRRTKYEKKM
jgi:hypothetical protein